MPHNEAACKLNEQTLNEIAALRQEAVRIMTLFEGMIQDKMAGLDMLGMQSIKWVPENNPQVILQITRKGDSIELFAMRNNQN